ncbi:Uncharacterised protein [Escherichia coli]|uniref:Uncharacterized protein n=1 Tax=Escherichia coli TaxID=562 RepID=A0A2X1NBP5_ECOLX|nr:Uncharacterised protein [Escherichia coli]
MDNSGSPVLICAVPWGNTSVKSSLLLINTGVVRSNPASRIAGISKEISRSPCIDLVTHVDVSGKEFAVQFYGVDTDMNQDLHTII